MNLSEIKNGKRKHRVDRMSDKRLSFSYNITYRWRRFLLVQAKRFFCRCGKQGEIYYCDENYGYYDIIADFTLGANGIG